ncbi:hypothetical protein FQN57_000314 [Myotisia sp. PD_48]|nr:hypothetical protein FQN57_000314 [Myotisia sp. PD_48]
MPLLELPLAGPGYVILNFIRPVNIICLLAVVAASIVLLVKTFIVSNFFFFDAVTHVVVASISMFLIISDLNIFAGYFNRNWPLFGQDSGFFASGAVTVLLGMSTLGNLNNEATSTDSLGLPFWRVIIAAGIVTIVIGVVNIIVSFVFRDTSLGVTARHVRARGAVAAHEAVTRKSSYKSFQLGRTDSLPTYRSSTTSSPRSTSMRNTPRMPIKISSPVIETENNFVKSPTSPKFQQMTPDLAVPNLAHHPAMYSNHV